MKKCFPSSGKTATAFICGPDLGFALAVSVVFGLAVFVAIAATRNDSNIAAIWPANGILLASILMRPQPRSRRLTAALCFAANMIAGAAHGDALPVNLAYASINILEVAIAFHLIRRWIGSSFNFADWDTVARFVLIVGMAAPIAPSALGAWTAHMLLGSNFFEAMRTWFPADSLGLLVITPACLVMTAKHSAREQAVSAKEIIYQFCILILMTAFVFGQSIAPLPFLLLPVLVSIAFRLGTRYAALGSLLITAIAITATYSGMGPAALVLDGHNELRIWFVQLFCAVNLLTALAVAAAVCERDKLRLELEKASKRAEDVRNKLDVALTHMSQGVCLFDAEGRITMRNDRFLELYGLEPSNVPLGIEFSELAALCEAAESAPSNTSYAADLHSNSDVDQELKDGRCIRISQRLLKDKGCVATYTDITSDKKSEDDLIYRTCHDVLTDLPNRRLLSDNLDHLVISATRDPPSFAVLLLDVDHFKSVNDNYGHSVGDKLLKLVARRLEACVRDGDLVARLGGDEFAILLPNSSNEHVAIVAKRILESIRAPMLIDHHSLEIGLSIGIALASPKINSADELLRAADTALYKSKHNGRNRFSFFSDWGAPLPLLNGPLIPTTTGEAA